MNSIMESRAAFQKAVVFVSIIIIYIIVSAYEENLSSAPERLLQSRRGYIYCYLHANAPEGLGDAIKDTFRAAYKVLKLQNVLVPQVTLDWRQWNNWLKLFIFSWLAPPHLMPNLHKLNKHESDHRRAYWPLFLFGAVLLGAVCIDGVRLSILAARSLIVKMWNAFYGAPSLRSSYEELAASQEPSQRRHLEQKEEKRVTNYPLVIFMHMMHQILCASLSLIGVYTISLDPIQGVAYELILIWVCYTLFDCLIQTLVRATTCPLEKPMKSVAVNVVFMFVPFGSDRVDQFIDWTFIGICFLSMGVWGCALGILGLIVMLYSLGTLYSAAELIEEMEEEFMPLLVPPDEDRVSFMNAWTSVDSFQKYCSQQVQAAATLYRITLEYTENLPQAILKCMYLAFVMRQLTGFVVFTALVNISKPGFLLIARRCLAESEASTRRLMLKKLRDPDATVREAACATLCNVITQEDINAVRILIPLLQDEKPGIRAKAAEAAGKAAPQGDEHALRHLIPLLKDDVGDVRANASEAIVKVATHGGDTALKNLIPLLKDDNRVASSITSDAVERGPDDFASNTAIVIAALRQHGHALKHASEEMKSNLQIVMAAVQQDWRAHIYASRDVQNTEDVKAIVKHAIGEDGKRLQEASDEMKSDLQIAMVAVQQDGDSLRHASKEMKNNLQITIAAVKQLGDALKHASDEIKNNMQVVMAAVEHRGRALSYASEELKDNLQIVMAAVMQDGFALEDASTKMKNNLQIVTAAVGQQGFALEHASVEMKNNPQIVMTAMQQDWRSHKYATVGVQSMEEVTAIVMAKVGGRGTVLEDASDYMKNDKDILRTAFQQTGLNFTAEEMTSSTQIVMAAVRQKHEALKLVSGSMKDDEKIVLAAIATELRNFPDYDDAQESFGLASKRVQRIERVRVAARVY